MTENQPVVKPLFSIICLTENSDSASQTPKKQEDRNYSVLPLVTSILLAVGQLAMKVNDKPTDCWPAGLQDCIRYLLIIF